MRILCREFPWKIGQCLMYLACCVKSARITILHCAFICWLLDSVLRPWCPSIDCDWIKLSSHPSIFISWLFVGYILEVIRVLTVINIFIDQPYKNTVPSLCSHVFIIISIKLLLWKLPWFKSRKNLPLQKPSNLLYTVWFNVESLALEQFDSIY